MYVFAVRLLEPFFRESRTPFRTIGSEFVTWLKSRNSARDYDFIILVVERLFVFKKYFSGYKSFLILIF